jgi:CDGSH-type Zn-finger protein
MPEFETVEKGGHIRHIVKIQPGERVHLCRCYGSKTFPFCDGTHKEIHSNVGPVIIEIILPEDIPAQEGE